VSGKISYYVQQALLGREVVKGRSAFSGYKELASVRSIGVKKKQSLANIASEPSLHGVPFACGRNFR
jgi:hypothetical protein